MHLLLSTKSCNVKYFVYACSPADLQPIAKQTSSFKVSVKNSKTQNNVQKIMKLFKFIVENMISLQ